jgi:inner membrane protein
MALIFVELTISERFHIFHYLLLAFALVLFFSLLNAISEQLGFNIAYLIAASSTITLISLFLRTLVKNYKPVLILSGLLVFLYSFIFILLSLNDYAYLAGNIGLFLMLAILMMISSKFRLFNNNKEVAGDTD